MWGVGRSGATGLYLGGQLAGAERLACIWVWWGVGRSEATGLYCSSIVILKIDTGETNLANLNLHCKSNPHQISHQTNHRLAIFKLFGMTFPACSFSFPCHQIPGSWVPPNKDHSIDNSAYYLLLHIVLIQHFINTDIIAANIIRITIS